MSNIRNFGMVKATIYPRKKQVVLSCKRGPGRVPDSQAAKIAQWAVAGVQDLKREGYQIDTSGIAVFLRAG